MDQHFVKKPSKSRPGSTKIEVWRASAQVWRRLGPSWANHPKMDQINVKKPSKSRPGGTKIEVQRASAQVWRRLRPSWANQPVFGGVLDRLGGILDCLGSVLEASRRGLGGLLGGLWPRKVANMAPTWPPKRSQNQLKIDPKIDQIFSASWNRFWKDFDGLWMPK